MVGQVINDELEESVKTILSELGEDIARDGLIETPRRVSKALQFLCSGYNQNPAEILSKTFSQKYDEMVVLKDIEFYSMCEHHMQLFFGKAHVGYIPQGRVVGISKIARLVDCFARRLQIQERMCSEIADSIFTILNPKGVACIIEAKHMCMTARGVEKQNSIMTTSAMRGVFMTELNTRQEFLRLIGK